MHQLGMKTSIRSAEEFFLYLVLLKTQSDSLSNGMSDSNTGGPWLARILGQRINRASQIRASEVMY